MRNAEIEAAILAAPDDPSAYQVYADWLQSQGDPRGELIMLQHAMRANNDIEEFSRFRKHEEVLRNEHVAAWLGAPIASVPERVYLVWRLGFVETARLDAWHRPQLVADATDPTNPYQIQRVHEPSLTELVGSLVDSPCGWLVRTLTLRASIAEIFEATSRLPSANLRKLHLMPSRTHEDAKRELAPLIMRMLNANIDVDLGAPPLVEKFSWVRPTPSKRRT